MTLVESISTKQAQTILAPFNCLETKTIHSAEEKKSVQQAVLQLAQNSDNQILGILANSFDQAVRSLHTYATALGHQPPNNIEPCTEAVYLKFNPLSGLCYASLYTGEHRGVLISFQSDDVDGINEMCGHLPLDLFDL